MSERNPLLKIGQVSFCAVRGDITDLEADALVQPSGTSRGGHPVQVSPWVIAADVDGSIAKALHAHHPFKLGDVIITSAGHSKAKYLFSAVVIDWGHQRSESELLSPEVVTSTATRCVEIAAAMHLKSIAFTPWGTRVGAIEASHVTALLVQAIAFAVQDHTEDLRFVYFVSNNEQHYQWFVDRTFMFDVMFQQIVQIRQELSNLNLSVDVSARLTELLGNLQHNLKSTVNIFLDQSQNVATGGGAFVDGNVTAGGAVVGRDKLT
jgi:O-acetyl-ADP-ribose deacetylase (regulator of RNase III)